jgi:hypothetical protein
MIMMKSPSFAFNSVDVPGPNYQMWESMTGHEGMTVPQLVDKILRVNTLAWDIEKKPLRNIIINAHGMDTGGAIYIGGLGKEGLNKDTAAAFLRLKPKNLGTIWLVACQAAAGEYGKRLCQLIATNSRCQVVASDEDQEVGAWGTYRLWTSQNIIDEFEGTVYSFTPVGGMRIIDPHDDIFTTGDWED